MLCRVSSCGATAACSSIWWAAGRCGRCESVSLGPYRAPPRTLPCCHGYPLAAKLIPHPGAPGLSPVPMLWVTLGYLNKRLQYGPKPSPAHAAHADHTADAAHTVSAPDHFSPPGPRFPNASKTCGMPPTKWHWRSVESFVPGGPTPEASKRRLCPLVFLGLIPMPLKYSNT